jgi:hypothetical protein
MLVTPPRSNLAWRWQPHQVTVRWFACLVRSKNCERRLLASSCLSVRPHVPTRLPLDGFSRNFIFDFSKIRRDICEKRLSASSNPSVCPSVRTYQLGSHLTDFHEILYLIIFRKSVETFANSDYQLRGIRQSVRPSVRMYQLGSYWTDFNEIWYLSIFRRSVEKIQV